jgi:hypothetical protein
MGGWMDWILPAATAGAGYAMDRTKKYEQTRAAEDAYNQTSDYWDNYLKKLNMLYSSELSGQPTEGEYTARDTAYNKQSKTSAKQLQDQQALLTQNMYRAGVTGGKLTKQGLTDLTTASDEQLMQYKTDLDATLLERAANRQSQAKGIIAGAQGQAGASLLPLEQQVSASKNSLDATLNPASYAQYALPSLLAYGAGQVGNMLSPDTMGTNATAPYQTRDANGNMITVRAGGNAPYNPSLMMNQAAMQQLMGYAGVKPGTIKTGKSQDIKDGYLTETSQDIFGNATTKVISKLPEKSEDLLKTDPTTQSAVNYIMTPSGKTKADGTAETLQDRYIKTVNSKAWKTLSEGQKLAINTAYRKATLTNTEKLMDFVQNL